MKKFINNLLLALIVILPIAEQPVFAADKDLKSSVYNHLENWDTEFKISYYESDVLDVIRDIAKKDDYLNKSLTKLVYDREGNRATIKVTYRTTKEQEEYINSELTRINNSIITNNMSDFDKIKAINEYMVKRYEYDYSLTSNNAYTALTTGKATCQGYAMTAYKLLKLAGIENKIIVGNLNGNAHGWNLVKFNGKWYQLDITSNDSLGENKFFLKNDEYLRSNGFSWETDEYPICDQNFEVPTNNQGTSNSSAENASNNYGQSSSGYKSGVDGKWCISNTSSYFLKNTGSYATGWNKIDNQWYCLGNNGAMQTGWICYNGRWYYCYPANGVMAVNTIIEGYIVDSTGAWIA